MRAVRLSVDGREGEESDQEHRAADAQGRPQSRGLRQALVRGARPPGPRRSILEERTRPDIPTTDVEIDGIAELWYDDRAAMERANATAEAKRLHDDGALFIGRIKSFVVEERVIIPVSPG
jgi:hypothetical protein